MSGYDDVPAPNAPVMTALELQLLFNGNSGAVLIVSDLMSDYNDVGVDGTAPLCVPLQLKWLVRQFQL